MFIASSGLTQSTFIAAVTAITVFVGGCATNPSEPTKKAVSEDSSTALYDLATGNELTELDFGEDWLASSSSPTSADNSVADVLASRSARALDQDPYWAVVLATYSGDNH